MIFTNKQNADSTDASGVLKTYTYMRSTHEFVDFSVDFEEYVNLFWRFMCV